MGDDANVSIFVIVNDPEPSLMKEVLAGIEEEGMPYTISSFTGNIVNETFRASQLTKLGVSIGIFKKRIVLHYSKSRGYGPLFDDELSSYELDRARRIGNNAARLYKVMPLKNVERGFDLSDTIDEVKRRVVAACSTMSS